MSVDNFHFFINNVEGIRFSAKRLKWIKIFNRKIANHGTLFLQETYCIIKNKRK